MIRRNLFILLTFIGFVGCKSSTSPESGPTGASGTIVFGDPFDVNSTTLGSNTSSVLFTGLDPYWTSSGQIIYDLSRNNTNDGNDHILVSNTNGTGTKTLLNIGEWITAVDVNPKMSPNGQYFTFNYYGDEKFAPTYGTIICKSDGTPWRYLDSLWDASWAPDGGIVVAGTVYSPEYTGSYATLLAPGLFKVDNQFTSITPIGSGLTNPMYPCVSPNGKTISFEMNSHIWTINMDGTALKQITSGANEETYSCWSPDGNSIAVESLGAIGFTSGTRLAIVPANTTTALSDSYSGWVADNSQQLKYLNPTREISWR